MNKTRLQEIEAQTKEYIVHVTGLWVFKNSMLLLGSEIRPIVDLFAWPKLGRVDAFMECLEEFELPFCVGPELPWVHDINCDAR